jgi:quercetin dioxygenase-like cupin family protein
MNSGLAAGPPVCELGIKIDREREMKINKLIMCSAVVGAALIVSLVGNNVGAEEYKLKTDVKELHNGPLTGAQGKTVMISHFSVPPGFETAKHYHPGAVFVYVLEGSLAIETEKGTKIVSAGELLEEVPNLDMVGRNASAAEPAKFLVFQVGDTGKPMMVKSN